MKKRILTVSVVGLFGIMIIGIALFLSNDSHYHMINKNSSPQNGDAKISFPIVKHSLQTSQLNSDDYITDGSKYGPPPRSLRDTQIDGELELDNEGNLLVTHNIRRLFDYFLSAHGEEPMETIIGRIEEYVKEMLPGDAAEKALAILDSYLLYKQGLFALEKDTAELREKNFTETINLAQAKEVLSIRRELRRKYMQPNVVDAFFGDEEMYEQFTLQRLEIQQNEDLLPEEKSDEIAKLTEQYPQDISFDWRETKNREALHDTTTKMQKEGASAEDIHQVREKAFGKEAAERLAVVDEQRTKWDLRIETYIVAKQKIIRSQELTEPEKEEQIEQLRQESFTERELLRVDVLERMYKKNRNS